MARASRGLQAYTLHGHTERGVLDYGEFFSFLAAADPIRRQASVRDLIVAIPRFHSRRLHHARFVSGTAGIAPLLYDYATGTERAGQIGKTEVVAATAWVTFDPEHRLVVIEKHRPGVPVYMIERSLALMGRELGYASQLTVSLNPIILDTFATEVEQFERIREARVVLARPNYDWTDGADRLSELADDSNASTSEVAMRAGRGASLSKSQGIVRDILDMLRSRLFVPVQDARITGRLPGEPHDRTISAAKHQLKRSVPVDTTLPTAEQDEIILGASEEFLRDMRELALTDAPPAGEWPQEARRVLQPKVQRPRELES